MLRIKRLPGIVLLPLASCLFLLLLGGRVVERARRADMIGLHGALSPDAAGASVDPSPSAGGVACGPVGPNAAACAEPAFGRVMEVMFEGITQTWRGREVIVHIWNHREIHERIRVEVAPSVLCDVPPGSWEYMLHDERNRILHPTHGEARPSDAILRFRLPAGCRVEGTIATADRSPFVGDLYIGDAWHMVATDARGAFDAGFVPEGTHEVAVLCKRSGFVTVGRIEAGGEGALRVHVGIRGNGSFRGSVRWEPMEGLDVSLRVFRTGRKEPVASVHSEGGPFEMSHLEAGSYELRSEALAAPVTFSVWDGQCTDVGTIEPLPPLEWRWRADRAAAGSGD